MQRPEPNLAEMAERDADDIFFRPSEFRLDVIQAVWDKAEDGPEPNTKIDWRTGKVVGPWLPGESRDGIWDMGHIVPWYKVVERLKYNNSRRLPENKMTREEVIDEFNDVDNLGVEDPETNRKLGINSTRKRIERLLGIAEEAVLFEEVPHHERDERIREFRTNIASAQETLDARLSLEREPMSDNAKDEVKEITLPKRVIVWDTETTGFHPDPKSGDKHGIVEIAAVELVDGKPTGREYHQYINPGRKIPAQATRVHGITDEDVADKPKFSEIADEFLAFVGDAPLVAHNAPFDMRFINSELVRAKKDIISDDRKIDSLRLARTLLPELDDHDLDHLAEHYNIDTSEREEHHGGLIDTRILAKVYAELAQEAKNRNMPLFGGELVRDQESDISYLYRLANELLSGYGEQPDQVIVDQANLDALRVVGANQNPGFAAREATKSTQAEAGRNI